MVHKRINLEACSNLIGEAEMISVFQMVRQENLHKMEIQLTFKVALNEMVERLDLVTVKAQFCLLGNRRSISDPYSKLIINTTK